MNKVIASYIYETRKVCCRVATVNLFTQKQIDKLNEFLCADSDKHIRRAEIIYPESFTINNTNDLQEYIQMLVKEEDEKTFPASPLLSFDELFI